MSADDARQIVRMTRFQPTGRRPLDGGNADGAYCGIPVEEYIEQANRERFIILQIEDPEPMDQLDEIAAEQGYDMLLFGPGDFSHGCGIPGQTDDPQVVEARRRVAEVAAQHDKFAGTTGSPQTLPELVEMGFQFVNVAADVVGLTQQCDRVLNKCQEALDTR